MGGKKAVKATPKPPAIARMPMAIGLRGVVIAAATSGNIFEISPPCRAPFLNVD